MSNQLQPLTTQEADLKRVMSNNRHATTQCLIVTIGLASVLCSLIWGLVTYNLEAVKHPIDIQHKETNTVQHQADTSVQRN